MFRGFRVSIKERGGRKPSFVPRHRLVSAPSPSPLRPRSAPLRIAPQHRREDRKTVPRQYKHPERPCGPARGQAEYVKKVNAIKGTKDNRGHAGRGLLCGQLERLWEMPRDQQRNGVLPVSLNLTSSFVGAYRTSLSLYGGPRSLPERQPEKRSFVNSSKVLRSLYGGPRSLPERQPAGPFEKRSFVNPSKVLR